MEAVAAYFGALSLSSLGARVPSGIAQGLIWGVMALGVYVTFRLLDVADLSVDGTFATGGAVTVMLILAGVNPWLAIVIAFAVGLLAGSVTGLLHTKLGIPAILAGILTQYALYSINLAIMGF
ncbi:MAG: ABC transporter permease, partial [Lachnospiraceae bacterium]|nr:ABC transporter permease [Lachnospiraceae bacterium]